MPGRKLLTVEDFKAVFKEETHLIFDATEQRIQRPSHSEQQKKTYSGKKTHTVKSMLISTQKRVIKYLSPCCYGQQHDFSLLKKELPPALPWFKNFTIQVDLDYLGLAKEYECKNISIPYKKSKYHPLTDEQKNSIKRWPENVFVLNTPFQD